MATELHPASKPIAACATAWSASALGLVVAAHTGLHRPAADAAGLMAGVVAAIGGVDAIAGAINPIVWATDRGIRLAVSSQRRYAYMRTT
jgi:hypothetical protein